jgi:phosphoglycolate phosphatase
VTWTVGFDLDMTLIDSRPGVARAIDMLGVEFDLPLRGTTFADRLGPPLATLLVEATIPAMPGAQAALAAIEARNGRVLVVTGKHAPLARLHIAELGWRIDHLAGDLWSAGKAATLREQGAHLFVGDHVGDMNGARAAGVLAIGVSTGPCTAAELRAAGADVVLTDLTEFPAWLETEFGAVTTG